MFLCKDVHHGHVITGNLNIIGNNDIKNYYKRDFILGLNSSTIN